MHVWACSKHVKTREKKKKTLSWEKKFSFLTVCSVVFFLRKRHFFLWNSLKPPLKCEVWWPFILDHVWFFIAHVENVWSVVRVKFFWIKSFNVGWWFSKTCGNHLFKRFLIDKNRCRGKKAWVSSSYGRTIFTEFNLDPPS